MIDESMLMTVMILPFRRDEELNADNHIYEKLFSPRVLLRENVVRGGWKKWRAAHKSPSMNVCVCIKVFISRILFAFPQNNYRHLYETITRHFACKCEQWNVLKER